MTGTISWKSEFLSLSRRFADRIAVVDRDGSITYRDLFAHAAGIGAGGASLRRRSGRARRHVPAQRPWRGGGLPRRDACRRCRRASQRGAQRRRPRSLHGDGRRSHRRHQCRAGARRDAARCPRHRDRARRAGRSRPLRLPRRRRRQLGLPHLHLRHDRAPQGHRALTGRTLDRQCAAALGPAVRAGCRRQSAAGDAVLAWRCTDDARLSRRRRRAHPAAGRRYGARAGPDREAQGQPGVRPADRARQAAGVCR